MGNFKFLKSLDKNLYEIISEAEKLYRDEYFDQCIGQTRRFGEHICKSVLGPRRNGEQTFDDMLATLKDSATKSTQEKEFVEDLYCLKREGNASVHASAISKDGLRALECLKRAFEVGISYAVYYRKSKPTLLKLLYDTELLVTGERTKKSLTDRYKEAKLQNPQKNKSTGQKKKITKKKSLKKDSASKSKISFFKVLIIVSTTISATIILAILLLNAI